jgi:ArsR family transcriptional regulator
MTKSILESEVSHAASESTPTLTLRQTLAISRAIADPSRFEVLGIIARGDTRCADLRSCLTITAPTLSHHLKELESAGLIQTTRTGKFVTATFNLATWHAYLSSLESIGAPALSAQRKKA